MMGVGEKERDSEAYRCRCVGKQHEKQMCGRHVMDGFEVGDGEVFI